MGKLQFSEDAWEDFSYWLSGDIAEITQCGSHYRDK